MKASIIMPSLLTLTVFPPDFNTTVADSPVIDIRLLDTRFKVNMKHHSQPILILQSGLLQFWVKLDIQQKKKNSGGPDFIC